jgi:hypothetical protein
MKPTGWQRFWAIFILLLFLGVFIAMMCVCLQVDPSIRPDQDWYIMP